MRTLYEIANKIPEPKPISACFSEKQCSTFDKIYIILQEAAKEGKSSAEIKLSDYPDLSLDDWRKIRVLLEGNDKSIETRLTADNLNIPDIEDPFTKLYVTWFESGDAPW